MVIEDLFLPIYNTIKEFYKEVLKQLTPKQVRRIMKEHKIKGKKRRKVGWIKSKSNAKKWTYEMDKVNYKDTTGYRIISMDIKYVQTLEGYVYISWVIDHTSRKIIGAAYNDKMTYEDLVKPSVLEAIENLQSINQDLSLVIWHTDNGKQYYDEAFIELSNELSFILSKKRPNHFGGNAISENLFYHLSVEWIETKIYNTKTEAIDDIKNYEYFYNNERININLGGTPADYFK